jgi:hypothetical protein
MIALEPLQNRATTIHQDIDDTLDRMKTPFVRFDEVECGAQNRPNTTLNGIAITRRGTADERKNRLRGAFRR